MLNIEKYKDEILKEYKDNLDIIDAISDSTSLGNALFSIYDRRNNDKELDIIEWLTSEYKEPLLSDKEKAYLKNVIEPFGDYVAYVSKFATSKLDFLSIYISVNEEEKVRSFEIPFMYDLESMFKNIEYDKEYTLEELGL